MAGFPFLHRLFIATTTTHLFLLSFPSSPFTINAQEQEQESPPPSTSSPCPPGIGPPGAGCANGLWSPTSCHCECIPPFCRDPTTGQCSGGAGFCSTTNPWIECTLGSTCPWWDNPLKSESCTTGREVPPGTWDVYDTREVCCNVSHPFSNVCIPADEVDVIVEPPPTDYDLIPIRFVVSGLPNEVQVRQLKGDMMSVLRRVLTDVAKNQRDLKVTNVEENLVLNDGNMLTIQGGDVAYYGDVRREVYFYDVSVIRHRNKRFGPIIIAGLRESYGEVIEYIEHYTDMKYLGYGTDFFWCVDDEDSSEEEQQHMITLKMCSLTEEVVGVSFQLADLPPKLDVEKLTHEMIQIIKSLLKGIERLDIIDIRKEIVNVTTSRGGGGEENQIKDVFFDIHLAEKYGKPSFEPSVNNRLKRSMKTILDGIQSYTDAQGIYDLDWYLNGVGAYAVRPRPQADPPSDPPFAFPLWAIITLVTTAALLVCCCFGCIMLRMRQKKKTKRVNEQNMVNYLNVRQSYDDPQKHAHAHRHSRYDDVEQQQQSPHRHRKRRRSKSKKKHKNKHKKHKKNRRGKNTTHSKNQYRRRVKKYRVEVQNLREEVVHSKKKTRHRTAPTQDDGGDGDVPRKGTEYELNNMNSFVFASSDDDGGDDDGNPPPPFAHEENDDEDPVVRKDDTTEYELEYMNSFVFDTSSDSGRSSVSRSGGSYVSRSGGSYVSRSGGSYVSRSGSSYVSRSGSSYVSRSGSVRDDYNVESIGSIGSIHSMIASGDDDDDIDYEDERLDDEIHSISRPDPDGDYADPELAMDTGFWSVSVESPVGSRASQQWGDDGGEGGTV